MRAWLFKRIALFVGVVVLGLATALPAQAHRIYGNRDWGTAQHDTMGVSYLNHGNVVAMWQTFLLVYNTIPCQGVDGNFGNQTRSATISIQNFFSLTPDGIAGTQTLSAASGWMFQSGGDGFVTTNWTPVFSSGPHVPDYNYIYSAEWTWEAPGVVAPFEQMQPSDHPALLSFSKELACA